MSQRLMRISVTNMWRVYPTLVCTRERERQKTGKERKNLPVGRIVKVMERNKSGEEHMAAFLSLFSWAFALARDLAFNSSTVKHVFPILQSHASLLPAYFYPFWIRLNFEQLVWTEIWTDKNTFRWTNNVVEECNLSTKSRIRWPWKYESL